MQGYTFLPILIQIKAFWAAKYRSTPHLATPIQATKCASRFETTPTYSVLQIMEISNALACILDQVPSQTHYDVGTYIQGQRNQSGWLGQNRTTFFIAWLGNGR